MNNLTGLRGTLLSLGSVMVMALGACSTEEVDSDTQSTVDGGGREDETGGAADDGEAGEDESTGGTARDPTGGTTGTAGEASETAGSSGEDTSGGSGGAGGTGGTQSGSAGTAGEAAGTAGTEGGTAGTPAGAAGTAGAAAGTAGAGASAGTAGASAGAGGEGGVEPFCISEQRTLTGDPSEMCADLPFAASCTDETSPLGGFLCNYFAAYARPGVFDAMYGCLLTSVNDGCSEAAREVALGCLDTVMASTCAVAQIVPDQSDVTCELIVNGNDGSNGEDAYEACDDIEPDADADASIAKCTQTFSLFSDAARTQIYDCYLCYSAPDADTMTCGELFDICAFPDVEADSVEPYPYTEPHPEATWCSE